MPKRNLDRIREILLYAESIPVDPEEDFYSGYVDLMKSVTAEDSYQFILMRDAGFIEGKDASLGLFRITNSGHDFLDAIRDEKVWKKTKKQLTKVGGSAALEVVKAVAVNIVIQMLTLGGS